MQRVPMPTPITSTRRVREVGCKVRYLAIDNVEEHKEIEGYCTDAAKLLVAMAKRCVLLDSAVLIMLPLIA